MYDRDAPQEQAHGRFVAATHHIKKQKHAQYHSHDPYGQHRRINPFHPQTLRSLNEDPTRATARLLCYVDLGLRSQEMPRVHL